MLNLGAYALSSPAKMAYHGEKILTDLFSALGFSAVQEYHAGHDITLYSIKHERYYLSQNDLEKLATKIRFEGIKVANKYRRYNFEIRLIPPFHEVVFRTKNDVKTVKNAETYHTICIVK